MIPPLTTEMVVVSFIVLGPWTGISSSEGISGFSNDATITVLAMLVLSYGVSQTGAVQKLGERMASFAGTDQRKQLGATLAFARGFTSVSDPQSPGSVTEYNYVNFWPLFP